jgi:hypothetical protein
MKEYKIVDKNELTKEQIWNSIFNLNNRIFMKKKKHKFHYMILTDGIGCSLMFSKENYKRGMKQKKNKVEEQYIHKLDSPKKKELLEKKLIGIDPGKSDLLYCIDEKGTKFRYTQNQRRFETKKKKFNKIRQKEGETIIENKSLSKWEEELSEYNSKTLEFDEFKKYLEAKNKISKKIIIKYREEIYRKLKFKTFINTQSSEANMLNNLKKKFRCDPSKTVIGIGDYEETHHRKYHEPVKGKGFRKLLRRGGYELYLVNEYRTSCRCSWCGKQEIEGECEKFREKPHENGKTYLVHGLLRCKTCWRMWNRDVNGSQNILQVVRNELEGKGRPKHLRNSRS